MTNAQQRNRAPAQSPDVGFRVSRSTVYDTRQTVMDDLDGMAHAVPPTAGPGLASLPEAVAAAIMASSSSSSPTPTLSATALAWAASASAGATAAGGTKDGLLKSIAALEIPGPDMDPETCELLGPFALLIQGVMGLIVIGSLLVKRQRERPRSASSRASPIKASTYR